MEIRRRRINIGEAQSCVDLPLHGSSTDRGRMPLRAVMSLQRSGHMGMEMRTRSPTRDVFFRSLEIAEERIYGLTQAHSQRVIFLDQGTPQDYYHEEADGFVTTLPEACLSVTAADCLPIILCAGDEAVFG